jgi:aryl-alcohol dehydrogenase-like predicted oxidoreductase
MSELGVVVSMSSSGTRVLATLQEAQERETTRSPSRRHVLASCVPLCKQFGIGILPWSPLAGGFLSGKYRKDQPAPAGARLEKWKERFADFDNERGWRTIDALRAIAREKSTAASAIALAWLLAKPTVSSVIFGARSIAQLDDNLKAAELKLTPPEVQKLDEASALELGYPYKMFANIQQRW